MTSKRPIFFFMTLAIISVALALKLGGAAIFNQAQAQSAGDAAVLGLQDKDLLKESFRLQRALGDQVWPGLGGARIPLVVYNDRYEFLAGETNPPPPWAVVEEDDFWGQRYYRRAAGKPRSFAARVGEGWAGSLSTLDRMNRKSPLKLSRDFYVVILLHEMFHAFQAGAAPGRFQKALSVYAAEERYPANEPSFKESWNAEGSILAAALKAVEPADLLATTRKFLQTRQARRLKASLPEDLIAYERELEWLEGLAKYAEIRFYELAASLAKEPAFAIYRPGLPYWVWDFARLERILGNQEGDLRFYLAGMAQARLLDRLDPQWKQRAFQAGQFLEEMLRVTSE